MLIARLAASSMPVILWPQVIREEEGKREGELVLWAKTQRHIDWLWAQEAFLGHSLCCRLPSHGACSASLPRFFHVSDSQSTSLILFESLCPWKSGVEVLTLWGEGALLAALSLRLTLILYK